MVSAVDTNQKSPLKIATDLFDNFARNEIRYCHWKSNEHLLEGLAGETDLDVLVDRRHAGQCEHILAELEYKRVFSQSWGTYPGIEDWIGFDALTGKLVHIHLHYWLWTGRQFVKDQHLPWENMILETAVRDERFGVLISDPNVEIILLAVRAIVKMRYRDLFKIRFSGCCPLLPNMVREFEYLYARIDENQMRDYACRMLGQDTGFLVADLIISRSFLKPAGFRRALHCVPTSLAEHRRYNGPSVFLIHMRYLLYHKYLGLMRRLGYKSIHGKRLHTGGAVIAIIGADGSGKSTVITEIRRWLGWKLGVSQMYLGSGDGDVGSLLQTMKWLMALRGKGKVKSKQGRQSKQDSSAITSSSSESFPHQIVRFFFCFLVARHRMRALLRSKTIGSRGWISLADRYPQNQVKGICDGPPLPPDNASGLIKSLYAKIDSRYQQMEHLSPDLIIRLNVSKEVALQRKPDHVSEKVGKKIDVVNALIYPSSILVDIDATKPLNDVLLDVKKSIWDAL